MGSITSSGLGSGLDVASIISQLMSIEKQPLTALKKDESSINAKISSFGKIQSALATLRDKSAAFNTTGVWGRTATTLADTSVATVTSISGQNGVAGAYSLQVDALAVAQTVSSTAQTSSASTLSEGTLTIDIGKWGSGSPASTFTPKSGTTSLTVAIGAGDTSLSAIRDKINAANAGVTAGIVTDTSGARLTLRSTATGEENAFRIGVSETNDDGNTATGLSALAYDAAALSSPMSRNQTARDARAVVNGIAVTSPSNTIDGVVEGLSIKLNKTTTGPVEMSVAADHTDLKTKINDFMTSYNGLIDQIKTETKYDAETKSAGKLQSDRTALGLQTKMQALLYEEYSGSGAGSLKRLSDIGLSINATGHLELNSTKLDAALANPAQVKELLGGGSASDTTAQTGFMKRFRTFADAAQATDGPLETRTSSLKTQLRRNTDKQGSLDLHYQAVEERLRKQYDALDQRMSSINGLGSSVTMMIKRMYG